MKVIACVSWIGVLIGCVVGAVIGVTGMMVATGAPQEAVVICLALACAVIPYCWAKAWTELHNLESQERKPKFNYQSIPKN